MFENHRKYEKKLKIAENKKTHENEEMMNIRKIGKIAENNEKSPKKQTITENTKIAGK